MKPSATSALIQPAPLLVEPAVQPLDVADEPVESVVVVVEPVSAAMPPASAPPVVPVSVLPASGADAEQVPTVLSQVSPALHVPQDLPQPSGPQVLPVHLGWQHA